MFRRRILQITTNGSISPQEALLQSCQILRENYSLFIKEYSLESEEIKEAESEEEDNKEEEAISLNPNLLKMVSEMELSVRAANCLRNANIVTIANIATYTIPETTRR